MDIMLTTVAILDRIREYKNWSDYRASKELGVAQTTVSSWRHRGVIMRDSVGRKAAQILGVPEEVILLGLTAERYINTPAYRHLEELVTRLEEEHADKLAAAEDIETTTKTKRQKKG